MASGERRGWSANIMRLLLTLLWFAFAVADAGVVLWLYSGDWIGDKSLNDLLASLNRLFVPYLGAMLAFFFAARTADAPKPGALESSAFLVGAGTTLLWNAVVLFFVLLLPLHKSKAEIVTANLDRYGAMLSWLAAPGIGFFFGAQIRGNARGEADSRKTRRRMSAGATE